MTNKPDGIKKIIKSASDIINVVGPAVTTYGPRAVEFASKYAPRAIEAAGSAAKLVISSGPMANSTLTDVVAKACDETKEIYDKKERERILHKAREDVIAKRVYDISAEDFQKSWEINKSIGIKNSGFMSRPGCFVFVLMPNAYVTDYAKFEEVYVGSGMSLGDKVYEQVIGNGNPDVYADVKYGQSVYILLYPCAADNLEDMSSSLIFSLQAHLSYNAREINDGAQIIPDQTKDNYLPECPPQKTPTPSSASPLPISAFLKEAD